MNQRFTRFIGGLAVGLAVASGAWAQDLSPQVLQQMADIAQIKATFSPAQKKMDSALAYGILVTQGDQRVASVRNAFRPLRGTDTNTPSQEGTSDATIYSNVTIELSGDVDGIANAVAAAGGSVVYSSATFGMVTASVPVYAIESVVASSSVVRASVAPRAKVHVGSLTSQGYISHEANKVVSNLGYNGTGVKVGVLSDSALPARVAALKASGDLGPGTTVLPGQDGPTTGSDEGAAMMEIVQDMAPGSQLYFATAFTSVASFAANILALAAAGCKVIVDDVSYFNEGAFQDGPIAQAVNTVTAAGVVYLSSAGNSGSLTKGTSGTWEGDFKNGGVAGAPLTGAGNLHNFAPSGTQNYNALTVGTDIISLKWSDPLGASANDYDLYVVNAAGTTIIGASTGLQSGTQDPVEIVGGTFPAGSRIVVALFSGATRAMNVTTWGGVTQFATSGATQGHNAANSALSMAATFWNSAKTGTKPLTGAPNTNEVFSSDGPRKIFYTPTGVPITPGNVLFGTGGGTTLQKPDFAAADGVTTRTPGFNPFYGTSAAAPSAAGIAALILQARPTYTPAQVKAALQATALDSMGAGTDRDSGYGIAMALAAVQYALTH